MTYDQLEMLEAIVEKGSYKAAADHLHKSQPSLSMGIKKLEEEYGIRLFDRDQYRPKLTDEGKIFFGWARESLESFRTLDAIGKEMGNKKAEPMVRIVLDPLVQYEEADIAIGVNLKSNDRIEAVPFKGVDMIPVVHRRITKDYKKYPQIIVVSPDSHGSISSGPHCLVSDHALKHQLIKSGYGWGRLARHEIENDLKKKILVKVQDPVVKPFKVELMLMRNKNSGLGPIARKIWQGLSR